VGKGVEKGKTDNEDTTEPSRRMALSRAGALCSWQCHPVPCLAEPGRGESRTAAPSQWGLSCGYMKILLFSL